MTFSAGVVDLDEVRRASMVLVYEPLNTLGDSGASAGGLLCSLQLLRKVLLNSCLLLLVLVV